MADYGRISGEYSSLAAGTDIAPLSRGLQDDMCHAPHCGCLLQGDITVTYAGGDRETVSHGDLFYWPPGHSVKVGTDARLVLFSPQHEHGEVMQHRQATMAS